MESAIGTERPSTFHGSQPLTLSISCMPISLDQRNQYFRTKSIIDLG